MGENELRRSTEAQHRQVAIFSKEPDAECGAGPGLGAVMAEYLSAAGGDREAALSRLVEYMKEPQKVPTLRRDSTRYPNPMPSAQGLGLDDAKLRLVAEYILNMKPAATAVGGDASGR